MLLWICLIEQALGTGGGQKQGFEPPTIIASHRGGTAFVKDAETLFEMPSFAKQRSGPPGNYCKCFKSKNAGFYNRLPNFDHTPNTILQKLGFFQTILFSPFLLSMMKRHKKNDKQSSLTTMF